MHRKASKTRILIKMLREIQNLNMFTQNMSARDFSKDKKLIMLVLALLT